MSSQNDQPFALFQRKGSTMYSIRYSLNGKQTVKSLGERDKTRALSKAWDIWNTIQHKQDAGLDPQVRTMRHLSDEFLEHLRAQVRRGETKEWKLVDYPPVIQRYIVPYFADTDIAGITNPDLERYMGWRKDYWITGPGAEIDWIWTKRGNKQFKRKVKHEQPTISRLKTELVMLKALFDYAHFHGYISKLDMPRRTLRAPVGENRRPGFTPTEFEHLLAVSRERMKPDHCTELVHSPRSASYAKRHNSHTINDRTRLHWHVVFLAYTGLRPVEAKNLTWGDVEGFHPRRNEPSWKADIVLKVWGKNKYGDCIPKIAAVDALVQLYALFQREVGRKPEPSDPICADHNGNLVRSFNNGFNELLGAAGLKTDYRGKSRTTYSLRHFYITERLADRVDIYAIRTNTRTSIRMIEAFYADHDSRRFRDQLGG